MCISPGGGPVHLPPALMMLQSTCLSFTYMLKRSRYHHAQLFLTRYRKKYKIYYILRTETSKFRRFKWVNHSATGSIHKLDFFSCVQGKRRRRCYIEFMPVGFFDFLPSLSFSNPKIDRFLC